MWRDHLILSSLFYGLLCSCGTLQTRYISALIVEGNKYMWIPYLNTRFFCVNKHHQNNWLEWTSDEFLNAPCKVIIIWQMGSKWARSSERSDKASYKGCMLFFLPFFSPSLNDFFAVTYVTLFKFALCPLIQLLCLVKWMFFFFCFEFWLLFLVLNVHM